ncbi:MAG: glycosyltransferase family 2 protein [Microcystaceae cyanobacterium]
MTEIPILSICIPAYNRPLWLRRALETIADSNFSQVEVVITDDSDDQTAEEIAKEVLKNWSGKWCYEFHESRLGMAENWNRAISLATGEYVMVLHDDDFLLSGGLAKLLQAIERLNHRYPVLLFGVWIVDAQEQVMKRQVFKGDRFLSPPEALIRLFSDSSFVRFPGIIARRSLFKEVGFFNPEWKEPCDLEMWMRLFAKYGVYCCQEETVAYRVHSQALTMASFNQQTISILLNLFKELSKLGLLTKEQLQECKQLFFYQYILAGAWRQLRRRNWPAFKQVMKLLEIPNIKILVCPPKWWFFRAIFSLLSSWL